MKREALWYKKMPSGKVICLLCPHQCLLNEGKSGICRVRTNQQGTLISDIYGKVSAMHSDPIEKKPLYHFYPGRSIFSIGTVGCNLHCRFCQNCEISQVSVRDAVALKSMTSEEIVEIASNIPNNIGIAYTYNEPAIWFEFVEETAKGAIQKGLKNVMVTNGFINPEPLEGMFEYIDAFSVDLKAFSESFYQKITNSSLAPVKKTLELIRKSGKHLEIVNLIIPGLNDDPVEFTEMVNWIAGSLGSETVLHLSAYFPRYQSAEPPTPASTIHKLREIASQYLLFVYAGNLASELNDTICPKCKNTLIRRKGYQVDIQGINLKGACKNCENLVFQNF
jgi:pyruvate formate lyase activating enzyme